MHAATYTKITAPSQILADHNQQHRFLNIYRYQPVDTPAPACVDDEDELHPRSAYPEPARQSDQALSYPAAHPPHRTGRMALRYARR